MKKLLSIILSLAMMFSLSATVFAATKDTSSATLQKVSETFGIPVDVLTTLNQETLDSLIYDATNHTLVASSESYVKIVTDETGDIIMEESTKEAYLHDQRTRDPNPDSTSGWMKFHKTILDVNSSTGQASCAFTWLTPPSPRMTDVVGLALRNGTVKNNTVNGFYSHSDPYGSSSHDFIGQEITTSGGGATAEVDLAYTDFVNDNYDYAFLRLQFTKEGNAEGVTSTYAHQKISLGFAPSYTISRLGKIGITGLASITSYYTQETSYDDIVW